MPNLRVRIKTDRYEIEAEGPADIVHAQLASYFRLVGLETDRKEKDVAKLPAAPIPAPAIGSIARVQGKVVSLTVECKLVDGTILAILLGHQQLRNSLWVAGAEIMTGLRDSGHRIERADHVLKRLAGTGHVVVQGKRRLKRYRLTTDGVQKAEQIARTLAAS